MILQNISELGYIPKRIISLVPSQTELLHYLGLENETIGLTKFCIHPKEWFQTKTRIGGTKTIKTDIVNSLQPDLIIANKEENIKEQVGILAKEHPVWVTDVNNLEDALQMINDIGEITGKKNLALQLNESIKKEFARLAKQSSQGPKIKTAYLIWRNPYMTVGADTFINDMLLQCGFQNVFTDKKRYPEITVSELQNSGCQLILLSSEPYPFKQKHIDELATSLSGCKMVLADGEYFSWYGSRLLFAPRYFKKLMNSII